MYPWSYDTAGRFDEHVVVSEALRGNPLGDPHERPLWVYVPPGYADEPERRYPSIYVIQGYTGQLDMWRNRMPFGALATHAGDALFENCYAKDFPVVARALRDRYDGSFERFWEDFRARPGVFKPDDFELINTWGMAAAYSAGELPIDVATGKIVP